MIFRLSKRVLATAVQLNEATPSAVRTAKPSPSLEILKYQSSGESSSLTISTLSPALI
ncbi:hypothetical protein JGH11_10615 [Dysgonomonas sp. Marseille-P4677]|uniref:hypothetical protein n=1 Tax=Dysgonomonas sp. Marseille-P4677 TaxID=2364790 RepID=UPI0019131702|nr:hypothetical protein [Dysgonomonas sp. Marseille-P4677]MBK5721324.1 hypothetical protein [Dysgonomonas sp. Marseille-P4677]